MFYLRPPLRQGNDVVVNGAGAGKPDFVGVGVVDEVQQDIPQAREPVRLA